MWHFCDRYFVRDTTFSTSTTTSHSTTTTVEFDATLAPAFNTVRPVHQRPSVCTQAERVVGSAPSTVFFCTEVLRDGQPTSDSICEPTLHSVSEGGTNPPAPPPSSVTNASSIFTTTVPVLMGTNTDACPAWCRPLDSHITGGEQALMQPAAACERLSRQIGNSNGCAVCPLTMPGATTNSSSATCKLLDARITCDEWVAPTLETVRARTRACVCVRAFVRACTHLCTR